MSDTNAGHEMLYELKTPVGSFTALDGNSRIGFFACPDDEDYELLDDKYRPRGIIHLTRYEIGFPASSLELGKSYVFSFSDGDWDLCESGQGAECYGTHRRLVCRHRRRVALELL